MLMKNQQCVRHRSRALGLENKTNIPSLTFSAGQERNQFSSLTQSCLILCDPMDCSTPGIPVHHQHPELAQTHLHRFSDAIPPSHPQSSPFPLAFNLSKHQGVFQWVSVSHQVAKVLELQLQHPMNIQYINEYSVLPMNIQDWLPLGWTGLISLLPKGFSRVFSKTTVQKHQFFSTQLSLLFIYLFIYF